MERYLLSFHCYITQVEFNHITYTLIGDGSALDYFKVDEDSGQVQLKKSLNDATGTQYRVSMTNLSNVVPTRTV